MKTVFQAPIIGIPIELHYCDYRTFKNYFEKQTGNVFDNKQADGGVSTFIQGKKVKIVVWIDDDGNDDWVPIELIAHESFHVACKIRREIYDLEETENLIVGEQGEEDWAYMQGTITGKIAVAIDKAKTKKRRLDAKKKSVVTTED